MSAHVPACPVGPQVRVDDGDAAKLPWQAAAAGPGPRADGPSPLRSARGAGREREREREGWREGRKEGWRAGANPLVVFPSFSPWYPLVVRLLSACCPLVVHLLATCFLPPPPSSQSFRLSLLAEQLRRITNPALPPAIIAMEEKQVGSRSCRCVPPDAAKTHVVPLSPIGSRS